MSKLNSTTNQVGYDQWSRFYDQYSNPTVASDEIIFPPQWLHETAQKVLEIGCGTGRHTVKLVSQGHKIVAIDLSEGMLQIAKSKIPSDQVQFVQANFLSEDFNSENDFDMILVSLVLEHLPDLKIFFKKCAAKLRAQGRLYISEIHPDRTASGTFAHFKDPTSGEDVHLVSYPHTEAQILKEASEQGFTLQTSQTYYADDKLSELNPKWSKFMGKPMVQTWMFLKNS